MHILYKFRTCHIYRLSSNKSSGVKLWIIHSFCGYVVSLFYPFCCHDPGVRNRAWHNDLGYANVCSLHITLMFLTSNMFHRHCPITSWLCKCILEILALQRKWDVSCRRDCEFYLLKRKVTCMVCKWQKMFSNQSASSYTHLQQNILFECGILETVIRQRWCILSRNLCHG